MEEMIYLFWNGVVWRRWAPPHNPQIHPFHSTPQSEIEFHFFICWLGLRCTRSPCSSFGGAPMRIRPQPKKRARELREWNKKYFNNNLRCAGPHAHSFFLFFDAGPNPQQKEREWELREKKKEMSLLFKKKGVGSSLLLAGCLRLAAAYNPPKNSSPPTNSIPINPLSAQQIKFNLSAHSQRAKRNEFVVAVAERCRQYSCLCSFIPNHSIFDFMISHSMNMQQLYWRQITVIIYF